MPFILDRTARAYGQRPSALAGIRDEITALAFDIAVFMNAAKTEKDGIKETPQQELERLRMQFAALKAQGIG